MNKQLLEDWYNMQLSEDVDPELIQEKLEAELDQAIEDAIHSHMGRK